ncbi:MAG: hypothetical protein ACRCW6_01985, partial [Mycoplasmoidaceae bacterium]
IIVETNKEELIEKIINVINNSNYYSWIAWCQYSIKIPNQELYVKKRKITAHYLFYKYMDIKIENQQLMEKEALQNPKEKTVNKINKTPKYYRLQRKIKKMQARKKREKLELKNKKLKEKELNNG